MRMKHVGSESSLVWMSFKQPCQPFLTKLNEGVRPHGAADALRLVGDDELLLQLVQEAERQHVGVVGRAHHHVADAQGTCETETERRGGIVFVRKNPHQKKE